MLTRRLRRAAWRRLSTLPRPLDSPVDCTATVLITVFHRARLPNLEPLVRHLLRCSFIDQIVVSNHNPALSADVVRMATRLSDPRVNLINQAVPQGCGRRWQVAKDFRFRYLISIDDDVLLYPHQLRRLFVGLLARPEVPHGIAGICIDKDERTAYHQRVNRSVDYLTEVYAITRTHFVEYWRLHQSLQQRSARRPAAGEPAGDFLLLSRSGKGRPLIHDVGYVLRCETYAAPEIAMWRTSGFSQMVSDVVTELDALR
jgi:hypothetical protein